MPNQLHVGLVGYGLGGRVFHATLIRAVPELRIVGVQSRSAERRQQAATDLGCKTYATLEELLAERSVDLVVISTPHDQHRDQVVAALEAGKHVVVDKVMALSVAEADEMIAAAERVGRLFSVFQNRRWDGDFLTVRRALDDGLLGQPLVAEARVVSYARDRPPTWRSFRAHGGGPFRDWGAHITDQALLLFGPVASVWAHFAYADEYDVETAGECHLLHRSGVRFVYECGYTTRRPRPRWFVRGTLGTLEKHGLDPQEARLKEGQVEGVTPRWGPYEPPELYARVTTEMAGVPAEMVVETLPGRYLTYYENIADVLLRDAEPLVRPAEVRDEIRVLDAAAQSAASGEVVHLG